MAQAGEPALASLMLSVQRYGRVLRAPLNIPTVDENGEALSDGTVIAVDWPDGVELEPDHVEVASVERADGAAVQVVKEIYGS